MVCPRCIAAVRHVFHDLGLQPIYVQLGEVDLDTDLNDSQKSKLKQKLELLGFELLDDIRKQQIEKIKSIIIRQIHGGEDYKYNISEILSGELGKDYTQLSKLFSATEGITIEQYVILQKIEKVKELLAYEQLNLSEISFKLGYSSVAHLSAQFKKTTGLTPSQFKAQGIHLRRPIDQLQS